MADGFVELSPDKLQTPEGATELNRMLETLFRDSSSSGDFFFNYRKGLDLTIATGAITVTSSFHVVDTESAAASDDLDTINGGVEGDILILRAADSARTVVVKNGTGNIANGADFSLDHADDRITLQYDGTNWVSLAEKSNG